MYAPRFQRVCLLTLLPIFLGLSSSLAAIRDVTVYGATGNGGTDDTIAIYNAISALAPGDTLLFPCGTYLITYQLFINITNITVDGSSCATIRNTRSGTVMLIGGSGNGNPN